MAFVAVAQGIVGCGDDDNAPVAPKLDASTSDVALADVVDIDATLPDPDAGAFDIVDVADSPCATRADSGKVLFPSAPFDPIIGLSTLGAKRLVQRSSGFLTMEPDGTGLSATIASSRAAAALDATTIAAVSGDTAGPLLSLYNADGTPKKIGLRAYDSPPYATTVAGGGSEGVMVWGSPFGVFARGIATTDFMAPPFPVASSGAVGGFAASVARRDTGEFAVAFSGFVPDETKESRLSFVRVTTTGRIAQGFHLEIGATTRRVVQLVPRATGWALLFEYGTPARTHLALLDAEGRLDGPVHRLVGTSLGYGLASSGGELAVLALHDASSSTPDGGIADAGDGGADASTTAPPLPRVAIRPFDAKGAPLGDWTCVGDGVDSHGGTEGALLGEDNGYAIAYPRANADVAFVRVDRRGN
jgi:hypothetical protein